MSSLLGGIIGILLLIPFRKYFVSDMHGKYPFPEATATTQVLVSGEKGGSQAKPLIFARINRRFVRLHHRHLRLVGRDDQYPYRRGRRDAGGESQDRVESQYGRSVLGLGYIIGLKYSLIICAGSFLVWLVIIPAMSAIFSADVLTFGNDAITRPSGA